jgi:hypothetical protein
MVEQLERACSWMKTKLYQEPDRCYISHVDFLLRQQSLSILKLVASVKRLGLELQVISPDAYMKLAPLLYGKHNPVGRLFDAISGERGKPKIVSVDADQLQYLLDRATARAPFPQDAAITFRDVLFEMMNEMLGDKISNLLIAEPIENVGYMPAKHFSVVRSYLDTRKPSAALDDMEHILKVLRDVLEKNFSLPDVLLNVGDRRSALGDPYVGL